MPLPEMNLKLIIDINNNTQSFKMLDFSQQSIDYGDFKKAPSLFWSTLRTALANNTTIKGLMLGQQNAAIIDELLLPLKSYKSQISTLGLCNLDVASIEKLIPTLNPSTKLSDLILRKLDADSLEKLLPALQEPNSQISNLTLSELDSNSIERNIEKLSLVLPYRIKTLYLHKLDDSSIEKLLPALQRPNSQISTINFNNLESTCVEKLLPILHLPDSQISTLGLLYLNPESIEKLLLSLQHPDTPIRSLNCTLKADSIEKLLPALQHPNCQIVSLKLLEMDRTAVEKLLPFLVEDKCKITHLWLSNLTEEVLKLLHQGLSSKNSKIVVEGNFPPNWKCQFDAMRNQSKEIRPSTRSQAVPRSSSTYSLPVLFPYQPNNLGQFPALVCYPSSIVNGQLITQTRGTINSTEKQLSGTANNGRPEQGAIIQTFPKFREAKQSQSSSPSFISITPPTQQFHQVNFVPPPVSQTPPISTLNVQPNNQTSSETTSSTEKRASASINNSESPSPAKKTKGNSASQAFFSPSVANPQITSEAANPHPKDKNDLLYILCDASIQAENLEGSNSKHQFK